MSAQSVDNDSLAGLARHGYPRRLAASNDDGAVKLAELKVESSYVRRDLDEVIKVMKENRVDSILIKEAVASLKSRVETLPTYKEMFLTFAAMLTIFTAVILFADRIKTLLKI